MILTIYNTPHHCIPLYPLPFHYLSTSQELPSPQTRETARGTHFYIMPACKTKNELQKQSSASAQTSTPKISRHPPLSSVLVLLLSVLIPAPPPFTPPPPSRCCLIHLTFIHACMLCIHTYIHEFLHTPIYKYTYAHAHIRGTRAYITALHTGMLNWGSISSVKALSMIFR